MVTGAEDGRIVWKGPRKVFSPIYCSKPLLIASIELQCFMVTTSMVAVDCYKPSWLFFGEQQIQLVNDVCAEASLK